MVEDLNLGFIETSKDFYEKDAPGHLGYFTKVQLDYRFHPEVVIYGVRGDEREVLFKGMIEYSEELLIILNATQVI